MSSSDWLSSQKVSPNGVLGVSVAASRCEQGSNSTYFRFRRRFTEVYSSSQKGDFSVIKDFRSRGRSGKLSSHSVICGRIVPSMAPSAFCQHNVMSW
jgi:hypothetical protein